MLALSKSHFVARRKERSRVLNDEDMKQDSLTCRMRVARKKEVVALHGYNVLRSAHPSIVIIALEGHDDSIFYRSAIRLIDSRFEWRPHVCCGKDNVLGLRVLLNRNLNSDASNTYFIVDKDFDYLKDHEPSKNLYCTSSYSIENLLVTMNVFEKLLTGEYKCSISNEISDLKALFNTLLKEFFDAMRIANRALHYCRVNRIYSGNVEDDIKKYVNISLTGVKAKYNEDDLHKLVGFPKEKSISCLSETSNNFDKLDPRNDWRGKYVLFFFKELLSLLRDDRCSAHPNKFKERSPIKFDPKASTIISILSPMIDPPPCLKEFVKNISV